MGAPELCGSVTSGLGGREDMVSGLAPEGGWTGASWGWVGGRHDRRAGRDSGCVSHGSSSSSRDHRGLPGISGWAGQWEVSAWPVGGWGCGVLGGVFLTRLEQLSRAPR